MARKILLPLIVFGLLLGLASVGYGWTFGGPRVKRQMADFASQLVSCEPFQQTYIVPGLQTTMQREVKVSPAGLCYVWFQGIGGDLHCRFIESELSNVTQALNNSVAQIGFFANRLHLRYDSNNPDPLSELMDQRCTTSAVEFAETQRNDALIGVPEEPIPEPLCYALASDILNAALYFEFAPDNRVTGFTYGDHQADDGAYTAGYLGTYRGHLEDNELVVEETIQIEGDEQTRQQRWTFDEGFLEAGRLRYRRVNDCDAVLSEYVRRLNQ